MGIKICPKCSGKVSTSRNVCIHCGYVFLPTKKCPDCGENLNLDVLECPGCGYLFEKDKNIDLSPNNENESIVCAEINENDSIDEKYIKDEEKITEDKNYIVENEEADNSNNELSEINEENDIVENNLISVDNSEDCVEELNANDSSLKIECPYCGSKSLISIGLDYYMCETCKGKFLYAYNNILPININKNVEQKNVFIKNSQKEQISKIEETDRIQNSKNIAENRTDFEPKTYRRVKNKKLKKTAFKTFVLSKKCITLSVVIILIFSILGILTSALFIPKSNYDKAINIINNNSDDSKINEAAKILDKCKWKDSYNQANFAKARIDFNQGNFNDGIEYMHKGKGEVHIVYNTNGGSNIPSGILYDDYVSATPTKEGNHFEGWNIINYKFSSNNYKVYLRLSAKWAELNYLVSVSSINDLAGSVEIFGTSSKETSFKYRSSVTVLATTNSGYSFEGWYVDNKKVSSDSKYNFYMPAKSMHLKANWKVASYTLSISSNNDLAGSVEIFGTQNKLLEVTYNNLVNIIATPNSNYSFEGWYVDNKKVSSDSRYKFYMPAKSINYEARWSKKILTVSVQSNNEYRGTVSGGGNYEHGSSVTIVATPKSNCYFEGWYIDDTTTLVSSSNIFTFTLKNTVLYTAKFSSNKYNVIVKSENNACGQVSGSGSFEIGEKVNVTASAYSGYLFAGWYKDSQIVSSQQSYSFIMSSTNITLIAKWSYSSDFQFINNDDGTLSIKSFENKLLTDVIIPTEYKGNKITAIDSNAFSSTNSLLNVFIPKTINKISSCAFMMCSEHLSIYCESEIKPDSWSKNWNKWAPFSDDAFTTVWGVNLIDRQKYNNLYYVKGTLDNAQYIQILNCDDSACEIIVPTNINNIPVTTIANNAFRDKSNLEKIYLPNTILSIGTNVFKNTNHIVIYCQDESKPNEWNENWNCNRPVIWKHDEYFENNNIINGIKYIKSEINGVNVVLITGVDKEIKFVNIPKEIDGIDNIIICNGAFKDNDSIETVQISSGVKEIMDYAFSGCCQISNLIINEGVKKIGNYAFSGCSSISTLIMPDSLCEIGKSAFSRCSKLFSVTMSTNISTIPESCFYNCSSLNNISILPNISHISENAFSYTGLKNIFIPKTVKEIEKYAFIYCNALSVIYCEDENRPNSWSVNWNRKNIDFTNYEYYNVVWSSKN